MLRSALIVLALWAFLAQFAPAQQPVRFTIDNPLNLDWPWELTHKDFPVGTFQADTEYVAKMGQHVRPVQVERATVEGESVDRAWFIATVPRARGRRDGTPGVQVTIEPGKAETPLGMVTTQKWAAGQTAPDIGEMFPAGQLVKISNEHYTIRLLSGSSPDNPIPLSKAPHWFAGLWPKGAEGFAGMASWQGQTKITGITVTPLVTGPVFCDVEVTVNFAGPAEAANVETVAALPMVPGKQTHTYPPNEIPVERIAKHSPHYRAVLRFVAGDPWIEVLERFHLPGGEGQRHGYALHFGQGGPGGDRKRMAVDTAMRVRWFEYDSFGGNTSLKIGPARQRDIQKGRPYANLQPRWTQRGGGAQELLLTSGGAKPDNPDAPCVGVVATFASKWVAPYQHIIYGHVADGDRGWFEFPLADGSGGGRHYAQRSYALLAGPRSEFDSTGKLNQLIRRHTDWTLVAQMNKYVLQWKRDPAKAGPHILMSPEKLKKVRAEISADADTPTARAIRQTRGQLQQAEKDARALQAEMADLQTRMKAAESADDKAQLQAKIDNAKRKHKQLRRLLTDTDAKLYSFLAEGKAGSTSLPKVDLWIARRYQDDFLNPTTYTRRVHGWGWPDLYAAGKPIGGPLHAAAGYIFSDLDHWPGWHNGWSPGNPNFHTDKYMVALYAGAALRDHPHADEWVRFGLNNFRDDLGRVLLAPDGVGWECPGYSGYSFNLQLKVAKVIANTGYGDPIVSNPMTRATGVWHRKLLTPPDPRLGIRHEAPHGDTHRWTAGMGFGFARLAAYCADADPAFAREMMGTWHLLAGEDWQPSLEQALLEMDTSIEPMDPGKIDWSSQAFYGFGAVLRDEFGQAGESFCSVKAGPARGHYHNDELAYHLYVDGTPISLDYNCSYHPRADHAVLHNSMSFGTEGTVLHNARDKKVPAHEQLYGTARVGAFVTTDQADVLVAERTSEGLTMSPIDPHDHEFSRRYPSRRVKPITHRRTLVMVKHPTGDALSDYLVVLDQTNSAEPQQLNVHLLARDAKVDGRRILLEGQLDKDIVVHLAGASQPEVDLRSYHYLADERRPGPARYAVQPDEKVTAWHERLGQMMREAGADALPLDGVDAAAGLDAGKWHELVEATDGKALAVPPHWKGKWTWGEYQVWLRISTQPGTPVLWVLYAWPKDAEMPKIETLDGGTGVRLTANGKSETVSLTGPLTAPGKLVLTREGKTAELLDLSKLPALGKIPQAPLSR